MRYEKEDNLFITYKGAKFRVIARFEEGRDKTDWNSTDLVYVLENGKWIVSAHWTYGLVEPITYEWLLRANYPASLIRAAFKAGESFWKAFPKDEGFTGGTIPVPFTKP